MFRSKKKNRKNQAQKGNNPDISGSDVKRKLFFLVQSQSSHKKLGRKPAYGLQGRGKANQNVRVSELADKKRKDGRAADKSQS